MVTIQMKNPVGEERGNYVGSLVGGPEPGQTGGQFLVLVEITQVENDLFSFSILDWVSTCLSMVRSYIWNKSTVGDRESVLKSWSALGCWSSLPFENSK